MNRMCASVGLLAVAAAAGSAWGQSFMRAELVRSGLTSPVYVTAPAGDFNRIFIIQQKGVGGLQNVGNILVHDLTTNTTLPTPFLQLNNLPIPPNNDEQGLLGLAFDPNYASNGYFYINYTSNASANGTTIIARYQVSADPNVANPASATVLLTQTQPFKNHNGGWMGFGPDGFLYAALGDGGSGGDPGNNAQNMNTILGKMLRLDVSTVPYTIPATNPWVGIAGRRAEVWAYGLRNPWRASFDRQTGDLWIADVGQENWEEVNFQPASGAPPYTAANYGWRCYEGIAPYNTTGCPPQNTMTSPVHVYSSGTGSGNCSVTGGYVYRGCRIPQARGLYFFADFCSGRVWTFRLVNGLPTELTLRNTELNPPGGPAISTVSSFGEDANGELYITSLAGNLFRLVPTCYANCDSSTTAPVLNVADFTCFLQRFAASDCFANCDNSTEPPRLNVADFTCFLQRFAAGCP
jgi:glucose/arabinose dehydrogenase